MLARVEAKRRADESNGRRSRWRWLLSSAAVLWALAGAGSLDAATLEAPRRLEYRVAWNGIPAAHATIEVTRSEEAGAPAYTVDARASTNRFVDFFWRFRGEARTTLLAEPVLPLSFRYERRVNRAPTRTWIDFTPSAEHARGGYVKPTRRREEVIDARCLTDPITAGFHALTADARVGDVLTYRVFTGETHYRVRLSIRGEEVIAVPAGRFEALRVEPEVIKIKNGERRDRNMRDATIWVSRDPVRTLLRVRSEVFVGAVTLELVEVDRPG
jgi:hypothetical protein